MNISHIALHNFRNIQNLELTLCETANIIYGDNGQGKTNLIEAIWLFTGAKSFRGAKDSQLVRFGETKSKLQLTFFADERDQMAEMEIENRRTAKLNEIPMKSATEMAGRFCAVVFSPTHLALIKNGPVEKRKFMDTSICQMKPKYIHMMNQYVRVLDQRNKLLKELPYKGALYDTLDIWDSRLASYAAVLIKTRASFLERLRPEAKKLYGGISHDREVFDFQYVSTLGGNPAAELNVLEAELLERLRSHRQEDIKTRMTNYGPHRDDIEMTLEGRSARLYGSQGQQRSCVLALKLAECELIKETIGEYPVILLDDVMSELDVTRREFLLNQLRGRQMIMTCCDKAYFKMLGHGVSVKIKDGEAIYSRFY